MREWRKQLIALRGETRWFWSKIEEPVTIAGFLLVCWFLICVLGV
jgi:hypothetical protein